MRLSGVVGYTSVCADKLPREKHNAMKMETFVLKRQKLKFAFINICFWVKDVGDSSSMYAMYVYDDVSSKTSF